jgi:hypothetical protein
MISCDGDVKKASKCPNKFSWYDMLVNDRFQFLAITWLGGTILNQKASYTKENDEWALSNSEK